MPRPVGRAADRGLTLLELAIAVMILSMGTLAVLRATDQARGALGQATPRILAQLAARNHAEALRLPDLGIPQSETLGPHVFALTTRTEATAEGLTLVHVTARATGGPGAGLVTVLPPGGR